VVGTQNNQWKNIEDKKRIPALFQNDPPYQAEIIIATISVRTISTIARLNIRYAWSPVFGAPNIFLYAQSDDIVYTKNTFFI